MKSRTSLLVALVACSFWSKGSVLKSFSVPKDTIADTTYADNGFIESIRYYQLQNRIAKSKTEAFALGLNPGDTLVYQRVFHEDFFIYTNHWDLICIKRIKPNSQPLFIFGSEESVGVFSTTYHLTSRANSNVSINIPLVSLTNHNISLELDNSSKKIFQLNSPFLLTARDTAVCTIQNSPSAGYKEQNLVLLVEGVPVVLRIKSFGYNLTSTDFGISYSIQTANDTLVYYRSGKEALLELYDEAGSTLIQTFSLALEKTDVDISGIMNGRYQLRTVNFKTNEAKICELVVNRE